MSKVIRMQGTVHTAESAGDVATVSGIAVPYNLIGYPTNGPLNGLAISAGAFDEWIEERSESLERDILGLYAHDSSQCLARTNNYSLEFSSSESGLEYKMTLDLTDPEAQSIWAKVKNGRVTAASIGFRVVESERTRLTDAGPDGSGKEIPTTLVTKGELYEVSFVPQGAYGGASAKTLAAEVGEDILFSDTVSETAAPRHDDLEAMIAAVGASRDLELVVEGEVRILRTRVETVSEDRLDMETWESEESSTTTYNETRTYEEGSLNADKDSKAEPEEQSDELESGKNTDEPTIHISGEVEDGILGDKSDPSEESLRLLAESLRIRARL